MIGKTWTNASDQAWEVRNHGCSLGSSSLHKKDRKWSCDCSRYNKYGYLSLGNMAAGLHGRGCVSRWTLESSIAMCKLYWKALILKKGSLAKK